MTTINDLSQIDAAADADKIMLYSAANSATRAITIGKLRAAIASLETAALTLLSQPDGADLVGYGSGTVGDVIGTLNGLRLAAGNLAAVAGWSAVPEIENNSVALDGAGGPLNAQAQALLNRTEQLKTDLDSKADRNSQLDLLTVGNGPVANVATGDNRHLLEIVNDNSSYQCFAMNAYGAATNGNNMHFNRYFGTLAAPAVITAGAFFKSEGYRGWDGSGELSQSMAAHQVIATEDWNAVAHGIKFHWEVAKAGSANRYPAMDLYSGATDGAILQLGDGSSMLSRIVNNSNTGALQLHGSANQTGAQSIWYGAAHASTPYEVLHRANRTTWQSVGGSEFMRVTSSGLAIGKGADASYALEIKASGANAFNVTASTNTAMFYCTNGNGTFAAGENAAAAALNVRKDGTTSRSINAAGTINASGADYAEYMTKSDGCGAIAKGQIVGVDAAGKLTDKWAGSVSFVVKSTDPSYVGGDVWGSEEALGVARPAEPVFIAPAYAGSTDPGLAPVPPSAPTADAPVEPAAPAGDATDEEVAVYQAACEQYRTDLAAYTDIQNAYQARLADFHAADVAYQAALGTFEADRQAHADAVAAAQALFVAATMPAYRVALADFEARLEAARQKVDRIAYCGQVPVNVLGAVPGQYVVPVQDGDGIGAVLVDDAAITFEQYRRAVGIVQNILPDGRANVRVKIV